MATLTTCNGLTLSEAYVIHRNHVFGLRVTDRLHATALAVIEAAQPPVVEQPAIDWFTDDGSEDAIDWHALDRADSLQRAEIRAQHFNDRGLFI